MLNSYLTRIGYQGPRSPTLAALRAIHRRHVLSIAYENIDVVQQRPVDRTIAHIHDKLVTRQRGGWCYEMNGLLGWALTQLGFRVTQLSGGVMRAERGDETYGNHLLLKIDFDEPQAGSNCWLADVGLGDGLLEPIPLVVGNYQQRHSNFALVELDEATAAPTLRFVNRQGGLPPSFDFINQPADPALLDSTCSTLQSDANSMFRRNLVVQRVTEQGAHLLLGRLYTAPGGQRALLESEAALSALLSDTFGIVNPPLNGLWNSVYNRHAELFGDTPASQIQLGPAPQPN